MERKTFSPGEKVPETGTYQCDFCNEYGEFYQLNITEGAEFPECSGCKEKARWYKIKKQKKKED